MSGGTADASIECLRKFYARRNYSDGTSQAARALARSAARRGLPLFNIGAVSLEDEEKAWVALSDAASTKAELPLPGMEVEARYGHRFFDAVVLAVSSVSIKVRWHFDGSEDELRPDEVRCKPPAAAAAASSPSSSSSSPLVEEEACSSVASKSGSSSLLGLLGDGRRLARGSVGTSARLVPASMSGPKASHVALASEPSFSSSSSGIEATPVVAGSAASSSLSSSSGHPGSTGGKEAASSNGDGKLSMTDESKEDVHEKLMEFLSQARQPRHAEKRKRLLRRCASEGRVFGDGLMLRPEAVEAAIHQAERELGVIEEENHQSSWKGSDNSSWWASSQSEHRSWWESNDESKWQGVAQEAEEKVEMIWDERKQKFVRRVQSKDEAASDWSRSDGHEAESRSNGTGAEVNSDEAIDRRVSKCVEYLQQCSEVQPAISVLRRAEGGKVAEAAIARLATQTASDTLGLGRFQ